MMKLKTMPVILRPLLAVALLAFLTAVPSRAYAQEPSAAPPSQQTPADPAKKDNESAPKRKGAVGQLIEENRESTGAEEEDNVNLTHAAPIRWLARKTGLSVHQAHLVALSLNFAIVVVVVFWAARKSLPAMFRNRNQSIQQALEEARAASQDANRRLADIENRLRQLDVEIGQMQATAEKAADAKEARRELTTHTAGLAIALARQQINVDSNTDRILVRTFASKLASQPSSQGSSHNDDG